MIHLGEVRGLEFVPITFEVADDLASWHAEIPGKDGYMGILPGGSKNAYLLVGLGLITAGFITATRYH